jgi:hypothetical protein
MTRSLKRYSRTIDQSKLPFRGVFLAGDQWVAM